MKARLGQLLRERSAAAGCEAHHALTQDPQSAVHRAAHTLKSTGAAVGAVRLAAVAKVLEDATRETLP